MIAQDLQTDGQWKVVTLSLDFSITRRQDLYLEHVKVKVPEREEYCSSWEQSSRTADQVFRQEKTVWSHPERRNHWSDESE